MKFLKVFALVLAVCLLGSALVACNAGGEKDTEPAETTATVTINLIVKDGSTTVYEGSTTCDGTLGNAIEIFCAGEGFDGECFNATTGILESVGDVKATDGKSFIAYYEEEGKTKAFDSIKTQAVESGKTVVVALD